MSLTIIDTSLYCQIEDDQFVGTNRCHAYDFLRAEMYEWKTHSDATLE